MIFQIVLELAREPGHPQGDPGHAYHLHMPLREDGTLDAEAYRAQPALCHVVRYRPGQAEARGRIVHGPGGRWSFDYDESSDRDDEAGFRFASEHFIVGEYVSITEDDARTHTYRIVAVRPDARLR